MSARRAHIAGTRRKLRPKKAKEPLITLTKSSLVTPIAPPRRARAASREGGVGLRSAGVGAAILDADSCVAVAEATSRAKAIFIIQMLARSITSGCRGFLAPSSSRGCFGSCDLKRPHDAEGTLYQPALRRREHAMLRA